MKPGTVQYDKDRLELRFVLTDGVAEVPVFHKGTPPGMFKEGQGWWWRAASKKGSSRAPTSW